MTMTPSKKNPSESLNKVMSHITPAEKGNGISGTLGSLRRKGKLARAYLRPRFAPGWELGVPTVWPTIKATAIWRALLNPQRTQLP